MPRAGKRGLGREWRSDAAEARRQRDAERDSAGRGRLEEAQKRPDAKRGLDAGQRLAEARLQDEEAGSAGRARLAGEWTRAGSRLAGGFGQLGAVRRGAFFEPRDAARGPAWVPLHEEQLQRLLQVDGLKLRVTGATSE